VSEFNKLESGSFVDYESAKSFKFDHVALTPSGWENYAIDEDTASKMYVYMLWKGKLIAVVRIVNPSERMSWNIIRPCQHMLSTLPLQPTKTKNPIPSSSSETNTTNRTFGTRSLNLALKNPFLTFLQERSMAFCIQIQPPHLHSQRHRHHHRPLLRRRKRTSNYRPPRRKVRRYHGSGARQGHCRGRKGVSRGVE